VGETFKYERVIPTPMAKGSGKGKKGGKSKKGGKPKKEDKGKQTASQKSRFSPIKTQVHESDTKEVTAIQAFLTSLILFSLLLGPIMGLGAYLARDMSAVSGLFPAKEEAFMGGMAIGIAISFLISLLFVRKAVASS
jgi:hypothetical protein